VKGPNPHKFPRIPTPLSAIGISAFSWKETEAGKSHGWMERWTTRTQLQQQQSAGETERWKGALRQLLHSRNYKSGAGV